MDHLDELEASSIYILREAHRRLEPLAMLWSAGKDSNVLLSLARRAFFGRVPFPLVLLDTGNEFPEIYALRDQLIAQWKLHHIAADCPAIAAADASLPPKARAAARKTLGLRQVVQGLGLRGVVLGIRRDEQAVRGKERVFSPRDENGCWSRHDQPAEPWNQFGEPRRGGHMRVHPLLEWSEIDVWHYIERYGVPVPSLYFARGGMRFRSLGERDITVPIPSTAASVGEIIAELEATRVPERAGRTMDRETEDAFERLRAGGYM